MHDPVRLTPGVDIIKQFDQRFGLQYWQGMNQVVEFGDQLRQIANVVRHAQAGAELLDQPDACRTVAVVARPERFWRQPFAEIVA